MNVFKRTFAARNHPPGSVERNRLNHDARTSEYMPSYRYMLVTDNGAPTPYSYRTKTEAVDAARGLAA
jgi:hypothetical protein